MAGTLRKAAQASGIWVLVLLVVAALWPPALRACAVVLLDRWFTWYVTVQAGQQLVSRGPYRLIRHPSYTGALITFVASCALLRSWVAAVFAALALVLAFARRIRYEEALLVQALPGYQASMSRTSKLLPG